VEVSGQLSNQAIREEINALWILTRDNVSVTSLERTPPESQPLALHTPKRVCRRLDPAKVEELTAAYGTGVGINDLAGRFKIHRSTVLEHLNRSETPRRYPAMDPGQVEEAARLYRQGQSLRALGVHFGRHASTVRMALIKARVQLRDRNGWERRSQGSGL